MVLFPPVMGAVTAGQTHDGAATLIFDSQPWADVAVIVTLVPDGIPVTVVPDTVPAVAVIVPLLVTVTLYVNKSAEQLFTPSAKVGKTLMVKLTPVLDELLQPLTV